MEYWIETFTGKKFDYTNVESNEIDIKDIAHALSNTCRFNGHCSRFYSVAEHSICVAANVKPIYRLAALLHDATEAYMPDVSKPLKGFWNQSFDLEEFEDRISRHIYNQLRVYINSEIWKEIKIYDYAALRKERDVLFKGRELWEFPEDIPLISTSIHGWFPSTAETRFLLIYNTLKKQYNEL